MYSRPLVALRRIRPSLATPTTSPEVITRGRKGKRRTIIYIVQPQVNGCACGIKRQLRIEGEHICSWMDHVPKPRLGHFPSEVALAHVKFYLGIGLFRLLTLHLK